MTLRYHVVYVRGATSRLMTCLDSIIDKSEWNFELVANGCTDDEIELLTARRDAHPDRVEVTLASSAVRSHGEILDWLLERETDDYFCFLDSDVFATGPIAADAMLPTADEACVCSCVPFWHEADDLRMPADFQIMAGRFNETADGVSIGSTYAAVYRTDPLRDALRKWDVSMQLLEWRELPRPVQVELEARGVKHKMYDTAKVPNLLLQSEGWHVANRSVPSAVHLGGQSGSVDAAFNIREYLRRRLWSSWPGLYGLTWRARGLGRDEARSLEELARRRRRVDELLHDVAIGRHRANGEATWIDADLLEAIRSLTVDGTVNR